MPTGRFNVVELSSTSVLPSLSTDSVVSLTTTSVVGLTTASAPLVVQSGAAAIASVIATTSGGLLQAANTGRKGLIAYSCTGSTSPAVVAYTTSVSSTNFSVVLNAGAYWEMPEVISTVGMSVAVSTIYAGTTATILVTELT